MSAIRQAGLELRGTLRLATPIIVGHLGQNLMGVADSVMIGHVGTVPLAASAFAGALFGMMFVISIGVLSSVSVRTAMAFGAGRTHECGEIVRHGLAIATALSLFFVACVALLMDELHRFGQPIDVLAEARPYMWIITWSLLPTLAYQVLRQFYEAVSRPWLPMVFVLVGVALNIFLNWVMIYGNLGAPAMGLVGAGWATLISRVAIAGALFVHLVSAAPMRDFLPVRWRSALSAASLRDLLKLGVPVGGQLMFEAGIFTAAAILMGWLGAVTLAAHQIAIACISTIFMLPLGVGLATSVRISQSVGAGEKGRLRPIAFGSLGATAVFMIGIALVLVAAGRLISSGFVNDAEVIATAANLLAVAAMFQLFDGTQVVASGALRGLTDVKVPAFITFIGYWVIGLPCAWLLGFPAGLGGIGVWLGLLAGLAVCSIWLTARLWHRTA
ncbi:MAG TPA: MATE family efflux transporter [Opitutaceae bacterium]|nr:MATE family efflux transporter [Opitutaceae bacterium]